MERLKYIRHNVLKRKEFEFKLKEQGNFLEKMKSLLDNFCYIQNVSDNPKNVFPLEEFASTLGYSKDEIVRMGSLSVPVLLHPDDFPKMTDYFQKTIFAGGEVFELEFRLKHRNGTWKWFSNRATFLEEESGTRKTINTAKEITRIKNLEESFFMTQEKLQAISSNPYLGVAILDREGKILDMNSTLQKLSGYERNELIWLSSADYLSLKGIRSICENLQRIRTGEIDSFQAETIVYPKYSGAFWAYMVFSAVHNIDGFPEYIACSIIDISETKLFEKLGGSTRTKPQK
jgi:PAS domain S-box-containing protein